MIEICSKWRFVEFIFLILYLLSPNASTLEGKVVNVTDGDTIKIFSDRMKILTVRLEGIDAPEKKQPFGMRSKQSLSDIVFGKDIQIETQKIDRYGRQVGKVLLHGRDVNLEQVARGMAWHYKAYSHEQSIEDRERYVEAENAARNAGDGLWRDTEPTPPWEWRRKHVSAQEQH